MCAATPSTPETVLEHGEYIVTSVPGPPHLAQVASPIAGIPAHFTEEQRLPYPAPR